MTMVSEIRKGVKQTHRLFSLEQIKRNLVFGGVRGSELM